MRGELSAAMKVGELARHAGISIRTLHHYDEIGLLRPTQTTVSGHRLYGRQAVLKLGRIRSLRRLGFSLEEVRSALSSGHRSPRDLIRCRLDAARAEMDQMQSQLEQLQAIHDRLTDAAPLAHLTDLLERMRVFETHFSVEQRQQIRRRSEQLGAHALDQWKQRTADIIKALRHEMKRGTDPTSMCVTRLRTAREANFREFTGDNKELEAAFARAYHSEPEQRRSRGVSDSLYHFLERAQATS